MQLLHRSQHQNVVTLYGYCVAPKENILVQEFMEHGSLTSWLKEHFRSVDYARDRLLPIFKHIACCLAAALNWIHHRGLIHRDVKPDNVLLSHDQVKLCDFGLACEMHIEPHDGGSPKDSVECSKSCALPLSSESTVVNPVKPTTKKRKWNSLYVDSSSLPAVVQTTDHQETIAFHGFAGTASFQAPEVIQETSYGLMCVGLFSVLHDSPQFTCCVCVCVVNRFQMRRV